MPASSVGAGVTDPSPMSRYPLIHSCSSVDGWLGKAAKSPMAGMPSVIS